MASGYYPTMREFWSARTCNSQADIPACLTGISFAGPDQVAYIDAASGQRILCSTLRGLLCAKLPAEGLGEKLFAHLMEAEEQVYAWAARGPRLFRDITASRELMAAGHPAAGGRADVVMLQEYDALPAEADYRGLGQQESFVAAMAAMGYAHVLFQEANLARKDPSGLGLFWNTKTFEFAGHPSSGHVEVACGSSIGESAHNVDLMEHWHRCDRSSADGRGVRELMNVADRRNLAMARLRHRASGQAVWAVTCHLMTTSRDSAKTNEYPGEVRAGELRAVREVLRARVPPGEAVIFAGDFNTDARELSVFEGRLKSKATGDMLEVPTGFVASDGGCSRALEWHAGEASLRMREALEPIHQWGAGVGPAGAAGGHCTSTNAERTDWIDYLWYSEGLLEPVALGDLRTPSSPIPDRQHGSDHLPIAARFQFRTVPEPSWSVWQACCFRGNPYV
mmetsp:Transcript_1996/g.7704  ORF Transcript_1996/g.7704 Transcript_1996/m.7704 type:complete len:452 (+) Transcript_1996:303-1658(+)